MSGKLELCRSCGTLGEYIIGSYFHCPVCDYAAIPRLVVWNSYWKPACEHLNTHYQVYGNQAGTWCIECGSLIRAT